MMAFGCCKYMLLTAAAAAVAVTFVASTNSVAIGAPVSPPSPTASENLGMLPNSSLAASAGQSHVYTQG